MSVDEAFLDRSEKLWILDESSEQSVSVLAHNNDKRNNNVYLPTAAFCYTGVK